MTIGRVLLAAAMTALLAVQGCSTSPAEPASIDPATGLPTGPVDTGTYPDLNIRPRAANTQLTPQQQQANKQALAARRSRVQGARSTPAAESGRLRRDLEARRTRGDEVLKDIEAGAE